MFVFGSFPSLELLHHRLGIVMERIQLDIYLSQSICARLIPVKLRTHVRTGLNFCTQGNKLGLEIKFSPSSLASIHPHPSHPSHIYIYIYIIPVWVSDFLKGLDEDGVKFYPHAWECRLIMRD